MSRDTIGEKAKKARESLLARLAKEEKETRQRASRTNQIAANKAFGAYLSTEGDQPKLADGSDFEFVELAEYWVIEDGADGSPSPVSVNVTGLAFDISSGVVVLSMDFQGRWRRHHVSELYPHGKHFYIALIRANKVWVASKAHAYESQKEAVMTIWEITEEDLLDGEGLDDI